MNIISRKDDHIKASILRHVESGSTWLDKIFIITDSAPEIDLKDVDTEVEIFGKKLSTPIIIGALTGGTEIDLKLIKLLQRLLKNID